MRLTSKTLWLAVAILSLALLAMIPVAGQISGAVCVACHQMRPFAKTHSTSTHAGVACVSCHKDPGISGSIDFASRQTFGMIPAWFAGTGVAGPETRVDSSRCRSEACHGNGPEGVVLAKGILVRHNSCAGPAARCTSCHATVAHDGEVRWQRGFSMDGCVGCHVERNASTDCETCHKDKVDRDQIASTAWRITHGPGWQKTHGMGNVRSCVTCHQPAYCSRCHGTPLPHPADFSNTHGGAAAAPKAKCPQCHDRKSFCDKCHGIEMPHPNGFLGRHSKLSSGRSDEKCLVCHYQDDCDLCHERHIHPGNTEGTLGGKLMPRVGGSK